MTAASIGSLFVALAVTPLEVIKVKMQAKHKAPSTQSYRSVSRDFFICGNGISEHRVLKDCFIPRVNGNQNGTFWYVARSTMKADGISGLYAGLAPTLLMAIPSNVLYFMSYETLKDHEAVRNILGPEFSPLISGALARMIASSASAPLELMRTRMALTNDTMFTTLRALCSKGGGVAESFRGLQVTLIRDVPFSALYWYLFEQIAVEPNSRTAIDAGMAGVISGMTASVMTHPIDVVKTRHQTVDVKSTPNSTMLGTMRQVIREGGLFAGMLPRLLKVGPACGIMIGTYEAAKGWSRH